MPSFQEYIESPQWSGLSTDQRRYVLEAWAEKYGIPQEVKNRLVPYTWESTQGTEGVFPAIASGAFRGLTMGLGRLEDVAPQEELPYIQASTAAHPVATTLADMAMFMLPVTGMAKGARLAGLGKLPTLAKIGTEAGAFTGIEAAGRGLHNEPVTMEDLIKSFAANTAMVGAGRGLGKLLGMGGKSLDKKLSAEEPVAEPQVPVTEPRAPAEQPPAPSSPGVFRWADLGPSIAEKEAIRQRNAAIEEAWERAVYSRRRQGGLDWMPFPDEPPAHLIGELPAAVLPPQFTPEDIAARKATLNRLNLALQLSRALPDTKAPKPGPRPDMLEGGPHIGEYYRQKALADMAERYSKMDAAALTKQEFLSPEDITSMMRGGERAPETFPFQRTSADISAPHIIEPRKWSIKDAKAVIERVQKGEPTTLKLDPAYGQALGLPSDEVLVKEVTPNGFRVETANGDTLHLQFDRANKTIPGVIGVEHRDTQFPAAPDTPIAGAELRGKTDVVATAESYEKDLGKASETFVKLDEGLTVTPAKSSLGLPGEDGIYSKEIMDIAAKRFRKWQEKGKLTNEGRVLLEDLREGRATLPEIIHKLDGGKNLLERAPEEHLRRIVTDWLENKIVSKEAATEAGTPIDRYNNIKYTIDENQKKFISKIMKRGVTPKDIDTLRGMEVQRRLKGYAKLLDDIGEPAKVEGKALKLEDGTTLEKPKDIEQVTQKIAEETTFTDSKPNQEVASLLNC